MASTTNQLLQIIGGWAVTQSTLYFGWRMAEKKYGDREWMNDVRVGTIIAVLVTNAFWMNMLVELKE